MIKRFSKGSDKKLILLMWLTSLLIVVLAIALTLQYKMSNHDVSQTKIGEVSFREKYEKVAKDHIYETIDADEARELLHEGTGVLFLGFPACPWCQTLSPYLDEVAKEVGIDKISYFDIRQDRTDNTGVYQDVVDTLEPFLDKDEDGNPRVYVPHIVVMKGGEVVGNYRIDLPDEQGLTPETYWNEETIQKAKEQLKAELEKL